MDLLNYYDTKFKDSWNASAISRLTPDSDEAKFIYDHLLAVGPKQWLIDAKLSDVFGTISTNGNEESHKDDAHDDLPVENNTQQISPLAKAFYYQDGKLLTEDNVRLDDELLASLEFPHSSNIQIV